MFKNRLERFFETIASFVPRLNIRPSMTLTPGRISIPIGEMPRTCTLENVFPSERGTLMSVISSADT